MIHNKLFYIPLLLAPLTVQAALIDLRTSSAFAVLAGSTITNTGSSIITGNIGVYPGLSITGFPPGIVQGGTIHLNDAVSQIAQLDLTTAYNVAADEPCNSNLSGQDLGGLTLIPGVYCFDSSAQLTGTLILNNTINPVAPFVFKINSTLTTASASKVEFLAANGGNMVFWQVGSSATLGTSSVFSGNILASTSITVNTGAVIDCGRALAQTGAVTLDNNTISACAAENPVGVPEPASLALVFISLAVFSYKRRS